MGTLIGTTNLALAMDGTTNGEVSRTGGSFVGDTKTGGRTLYCWARLVALASDNVFPLFSTSNAALTGFFIFKVQNKAITGNQNRLVIQTRVVGFGGTNCVLDTILTTGTTYLLGVRTDGTTLSLGINGVWGGTYYTAPLAGGVWFGDLGMTGTITSSLGKSTGVNNNGYLDECTMVNKALSGTEFLEVYAAGVNANPELLSFYAANVKHRWPIDNFTGASSPFTLPDVIGSDDFTLTAVSGNPSIAPFP